MDNSFFLTGGNGVLGKVLISFLRSKGNIVNGIDVCSAHQDEGAQSSITIGDINDTEKLALLLATHRPAFICHLAACLRTDHEKDYFATNVLGTISLFKAVSKAGIKAKVLVIGSSAEYGQCSERKKNDEQCSLNPVTLYGVSKLAQYHTTRICAAQYQIPYTYLRLFNHIVPGQDDKMVCSHYAKEIALIEKSVRSANLLVRSEKNIRDYIDTRDVVHAIYCAAQRGQTGEVYNICSGHGYSVRWVVEKLVALSSTKINLEYESVKEPNPQDVFCQVGDNSKARHDLDWSPNIPIEQSLSDILAYWRNSCLNV